MQRRRDGNGKRHSQEQGWPEMQEKPPRKYKLTSANSYPPHQELHNRKTNRHTSLT
ncbi:hypothetical protein BDZ94DRAFT_1259653 [Collybia nuda]|uniref:Uncharacterized protein n=1 Tax=Collybia nuda TaxID=64659 RepID=A0A9P5Y6I6_9AGAR|nr:hypothetical protein BDZ94DRAFT_1259653 [Collybia nuda]